MDDDGDESVIGGGAPELAVSEIDTGLAVSIGAVAGDAVVLVLNSAGFDVELGIAVLRKQRSCEDEWQR